MSIQSQLLAVSQNNGKVTYCYLFLNVFYTKCFTFVTRVNLCCELLLVPSFAIILFIVFEISLAANLLEPP